MQQQNQQNGELRSQVIAELRDWSVITCRPLPYTPEVIADLEGLGFVVDLADGSVSQAADILDARVGLTPTGRAAYEALKNGVVAA